MVSDCGLGGVSWLLLLVQGNCVRPICQNRTMSDNLQFGSQALPPSQPGPPQPPLGYPDASSAQPPQGYPYPDGNQPAQTYPGPSQPPQGYPNAGPVPSQGYPYNGPVQYPQGYAPTAPMIVPTPEKIFLPTELTDYMRYQRVPARRWWWGFITLPSLAVAFIVVILLGSIPMVMIDPTAVFDLTGFKVTPEIFLINNVIIAAMIPVTVLLSWLIYRQGFGWLTSVTGRFRWKWFWIPLGVFAAGYAVQMAIEIAILGPADYGLLDMRILPTTTFMIVAILLTTPLQCAGEEYLVRGGVARSLAALIPNKVAGLILAAVGSSAVFMLLHGAGDPWLNIVYFSMGLVLWWLAYRTGGLEASIALHVVNNLFAEFMMPFSDFSDLFERGEGTGSPVLLISVAVEIVLVLLVDFIARKKGLVRLAAPAAPTPTVAKPTKFISSIADSTVVATKADLPRIESTLRQLPLAPTPWGGANTGQPGQPTWNPGQPRWPSAPVEPMGEPSQPVETAQPLTTSVSDGPQSTSEQSTSDATDSLLDDGHEGRPNAQLGHTDGDQPLN